MSIREAPHTDKAIFFDLDGTLANSLDMLRGVYSRFMRNCGVVPDMDEFESINGVPLIDAVAMLKTKHEIGRSVRELTERYLAEVERTYVEVVPIEGVGALLKELVSEGWYLALVTSNNRLRTGNWLRKHRLYEYFSTLVCAEDIINPKPHPEPYLTALRRSGVDRNRAWVVEDAELGVQSALAAQLRAIYVGDHPLGGMKGLFTASSLGDVRKILNDHPV